MKTFKTIELDGVNSEASMDVSFYLIVRDNGSGSGCRLTECTGCGHGQTQEMQISRARAIDVLEDWNVLSYSPEEN